jgi:hypothetical protein
MKTFLRILFTPSCWLQLNPYSAVWDARLNELMKTHKFERNSECTAKIGNITVWIENHPYASFTADHGPRVRPSRRTILKAHDKLVSDLLDIS